MNIAHKTCDGKCGIALIGCFNDTFSIGDAKISRAFLITRCGTSVKQNKLKLGHKLSYMKLNDFLHLFLKSYPLLHPRNGYTSHDRRNIF